jgi:hypothetical protein
MFTEVGPSRCKDAEATSRNQESGRVTLIDLRDLVDLWVDYNDLLTDAGKGKLPPRPDSFRGTPKYRYEGGGSRKDAGAR